MAERKAKLNRQYQEALSVRDRAKINIISAQQSQVDAQLELVTGQLARAQLTAPFDGLVVSGDLSQRLGSAVSKGGTPCGITFTPLPHSYAGERKPDCRRGIGTEWHPAPFGPTGNAV
ncbi:hypothetical protein [Aliamphritea spongicola]|nr:hypothetical protein [Aliamphritea spongicola]